MKVPTFREFMLQRFKAGGFTTEDVLTTLLPLMRETLEAHQAGMVAPLERLDAIQISDYRAWFAESKRRELRTNSSAIRGIEQQQIRAFEVIGEYNSDTDLDEGTNKTENLQVGEFDEKVERRVYLPGYVSWEHEIEHHDPLTDVFSLGMLMASLSCCLDFENDEELAKFVEHRGNLFRLAPELHPVVARLIVRMTELDRHKRVQDLPTVIRTLENYRDQETDIEFDLAATEGFATKDHHTKQAVVLSKLKERLFDISKRNRLLNFRQTMQSVNLTQASVPLSFNLQTIRADQLLIWNDQLKKQVCSGKPLSLNKFLNFSEAIYLPGILDRILAEARKDTAEFGMAQLRLAICFLNWSNIKEKPIQRYESPLLLVPVKLAKKKGLSDRYTLEILDTNAEVNPVLRHQFKTFYEIDLPESIDLEKADVHQFFDFLQQRIESSRAGVTLEKIEKPHVSIVHQKAKRRLDQYRRRAKLSGRGMRSFKELDYSYDPANFHPLGVKIFANFIQPTSLQLREILETKPPRKRFMVDQPSAQSGESSDGENVAEVERTFVDLSNSDGDNPYAWKFDLCNVTLANFKYRKMSLVHDYDKLLESPQDNGAFDAVFSLSPRRQTENTSAPTRIEDRFDVVPCDPTQASSIAKARTGESYIIQGPPGTGKSQTIANLIADYVARGKRVLFVCEKRAAIDVVYSRLKQRGLGTLCCLIHDSQTDKKEFVMDLKATYEEFLESGKRRYASRKTILKAMRKSLDTLEAYHARMKSASDETGLPLRALLNQCLAMRADVPELDAFQKERLPDYGQWHRNQERLDELRELVNDFQVEGILSKHPLSCLSPRIVDEEHPLALVSSSCESAAKAIPKLADALSKCDAPQERRERVGDARMLVDFGERLLPLARKNQLSLLNPESELSTELQRAVGKFSSAKRKLEGQSQKTSGWKEKIPEGDLSTAIEQAKSFEGHYFAWLSPAWWRLRAVMNRAYDFKKHVVRPSWRAVLTDLKHEYDAQQSYQAVTEEVARGFGFDSDKPSELEEDLQRVATTQTWLEDQPVWLQDIFTQILENKDSTARLEQLGSSRDSVHQFSRLVDTIFDDNDSRTWAELEDRIRRVTDSIDELPDFMACLKRLDGLPPELTQAIRDLPLRFDQLQAGIADVTFERKLQDDRAISRFNYSEHQVETAALHDKYHEWLDANAGEILKRQRKGFLKRVELCEKAAAGLNPKEKELKKRYRAGRRTLEHEFGKTMRYKPIRDLMTGDSGEVLNDLKPVWLMSPLSVSDTLPLRDDLVDVVIFDEASQVTLEEAIPTIFRGPQAIVVGDEMQLPPTNFFASRKAEDETGLEFEEEGEVVQYDLNTNSLLSHSARNLPSTMLGWHYRSRSESLISFSNRAFYQGRLLTVPEETLPSSSQQPISVADMSSVENLGLQALARPVSFHHLPNAIYENRRNRDEADYIARLVRDFLRRNAEIGERGRGGDEAGDRLSIGLVAFSEAQQDEIELALNRLGQNDAEFRAMLDAELEREEDNQFVGLLVKNLENIQGDERDVIILSVCYARNPAGKMYMNFGPINKSGGEKRLNVAFSRAKRHMCIVSSITGDAITNDYNDGARCLKDYLSYAEACSTGAKENAAAILHRLSPSAPLDSLGAVSNTSTTTLVDQLSEKLEGKGWIVDRDIGQSSFRCDLAVRNPDDNQYRLGILVDGEAYYDIEDALERDVMRPRLLEAFGWDITFVLSKDWYLDPDSVVERIQRLLVTNNSEPQN